MKIFYLLFFAFLSVACFAENHQIQNNAKFNLIEQVENYFNDRLDTVKSNFKQIDSRGFTSTGKIFFKRKKGLMKLYYNDPNPNVAIVKNYKLTHFNRDLKEKTIISVYSSPLAFFLEKKIDLKQNVKIVSMDESQNSIEITFKKKGDEDEGAVTLMFSKKPFQLLGWIISENNKYGRQTHLSLENPDFNSSFPDEEFESFS